MIFVELIAHALFIISLTHLPGVYSASSQLTNANSEVGPKTSDYTGVGVPVNSTSIDKFADMPKTYIFDQDFRWGGGDNAVYDKDGKVVYTISTHYDPESTARTIVTKDADDKDLLKAFMPWRWCESGQVASTNKGITYKLKSRTLAPDQWLIQGGDLKSKDYIYHRHLHTNTGSIKIGKSENRVAKIFREHAQPGWQSDKIDNKELWTIRSNGGLAPEVLLCMLVVTIDYYTYCNV